MRTQQEIDARLQVYVTQYRKLERLENYGYRLDPSPRWRSFPLESRSFAGSSA
jgi:hypothetical protein